MHATIYGRPGCPYCVRAEQIARYLKEHRDDFSFEYIDMPSAGLTKEMLSQQLETPVRTVPQVLLDGTLIGGCDEFEAYTRKHLLPR